jgi:hypothetical protein
VEAIGWRKFYEMVKQTNPNEDGNTGRDILIKGPCLNVTLDGETLFYVIVQPEQAMKDRVEATCSLIDTGRGR